ncbi:MAG: hypothetical protein OQL08_08790 [Gammaproteobacteria bacterium]|nr:hypothetical protein [Gammaproteobacteria bacterium]
MDLSALFGIADGAFTGGLFGLAGTAIHAGLKAWDGHQETKKELAHRDYDLQELTLNNQLQVEMEESRLVGAKMEADNRLAVTEEQVAGEMRTASYEHDRSAYTQTLSDTFSGRLARFLLAAVDVVRGLMRPAITVAMLWMLWEIGSMLQRITGGTMPVDQASALWLQVVTAIITLATTCVTWWFGSRQLRRAGS